MKKLPKQLKNVLFTIIILIVAFGVSVLLQDVLTTKVKRSEEIKAIGEKEQMRANLFRFVSHDLRTPLTTIYGASSQ